MSEVNNVDSAEVVDTVESQEEVLEAQEQGAEESVESMEPEEQPKPRKKKFSIKVDGQEEEVEIDLDNEDEIKNHIQMSKAAQKRMSEAAKTKKQAEQFLQQLKTDPKKVLSDPNLGVDFRKIAEEYLYEQIQRESMSPEEIEYQEKMERLKKYEEQEMSRKEQEEQERMVQMQKKYAESYDYTITQALQESGLPKTPATVKRMAQLLMKNLDYGLDLDPKDLVEEVKKSYYSEFKELFSNGDVDFILQMLGGDISNKIRKKDLEKLKMPQNRVEATSKPKEMPPKQQEKGYMTPDEYKDWLNSRVRD